MSNPFFDANTIADGVFCARRLLLYKENPQHLVDLRKNEQKMFDFYKKYGILFCGTMPLRFRVSQTGRFYVLILYAGSGVRGEIRDPR